MNNLPKVTLHKTYKQLLLFNVNETSKRNLNEDYLFGELKFNIKYTPFDYEFCNVDIANIINDYKNDVIEIYYYINYGHNNQHITIYFGNTQDMCPTCEDNDDKKKISNQNSIINFKTVNISYQLIIVKKNSIIAVSCHNFFNNDQIYSPICVNMMSLIKYYLKTKYNIDYLNSLNDEMLNYYIINDQNIKQLTKNKYRIIEVKTNNETDYINVTNDTVKITNIKKFECVAGIIKEIIDTITQHLT